MRKFIASVLILSFLLSFSGCTLKNKPSVTELETRIREICEIPGYEHIYHDIVYIDEKTSFLSIPMVDKRALFAVDVRIQAGIDLSRGMRIEPLSRTTVKVVLPPAVILLADADEQSISQYFLKEFGGQVSRLDYYDEIERKKSELIQDAVKRGILTRAETNVRKIIENFLTLTGYQTVVFERMAAKAETDG